MPVRVVSIEDDPVEESKLEEQLNRYAREHGLEMDITHLRDAERFFVGHHDADVLFLDIDLPGMSGMDAARRIRQTNSVLPIVFVTSLAQYAITGYEVDAIGFMVKPARYYDLAMILGKVIRIMRRNTKETISFSTRSGVVAFLVDSVEYVETAGHNIEFHFVSQEEPFRMRDSLSSLESRIKDMAFVRVSQGQLANMAHIERVEADGVLMSTGEKLYFSRQRKKSCMERIARYMGRTI